MIPIKIGQAASAAQFIKEKFNLLVHTEELDDNWQTLWIYKQPYILEVIKSLPRVPETVFDHWVLGKLFGYDEAAILDYLDSSQF